MVNHMRVVQKLGGDLVSLVPKRAPERGKPSPGMVLTVNVSGNKLVLEDWLTRLLDEKIPEQDG